MNTLYNGDKLKICENREDQIGNVLAIPEIDDGRRERSSSAQSNQTKISLHPTRWQGTVLN
jgi:hypothetical protein